MNNNSKHVDFNWQKTFITLEFFHEIEMTVRLIHYLQSSINSCGHVWYAVHFFSAAIPNFHKMNFINLCLDIAQHSNQAEHNSTNKKNIKNKISILLCTI
jgi:hypothetical protein